MRSRKAPALALAAMAALLAGCAAAPPPSVGAMAPGRAPAALPQAVEPRLTPGAVNPFVTQTNIAVTICSPGWTKTIRPPVNFTNRLKLEQMPLYGYPLGTNFEGVVEDHREPLEIGGAPRDPRNLWPQPRDEAHAKDRLENAVKRDVCAGRLTLRQGQAIFLGDFWGEYDRRFSSALSVLGRRRSAKR